MSIPGGIEHVVLLTLKPGVTSERLDQLAAELESMQDNIPGILAVESGANNSPETLGQGYEWGFIVSFKNSAARDAYLPHPFHLGVASSVGAVAERVLVFDLLT